MFGAVAKIIYDTFDFDFSDAFDFAADCCLGKPVFGSNAGGLPLPPS